MAHCDSLSSCPWPGLRCVEERAPVALASAKVTCAVVTLGLCCMAGCRTAACGAAGSLPGRAAAVIGAGGAGGAAAASVRAAGGGGGGGGFMHGFGPVFNFTGAEAGAFCGVFGCCEYGSPPFFGAITRRGCGWGTLAVAGRRRFQPGGGCSGVTLAARGRF